MCNGDGSTDGFKGYRSRSTSDSMLVINQVTDEWDLKESYLKPYLEHLQ